MCVHAQLWHTCHWCGGLEELWKLILSFHQAITGDQTHVTRLGHSLCSQPSSQSKGVGQVVLKFAILLPLPLQHVLFLCITTACLKYFLKSSFHRTKDSQPEWRGQETMGKGLWGRDSSAPRLLRSSCVILLELDLHFNFSLKFYYFTLCIWVFCMPGALESSVMGCRWLPAAVWVPGIKPRTLRRRASNSWTISPLMCLCFLKLYFTYNTTYMSNNIIIALIQFWIEEKKKKNQVTKPLPQSEFLQTSLLSWVRVTSHV